MSRSKQRSKCRRSCGMCDPGKYAAGTPKPGDRRRMQDDPDPGKTQNDCHTGPWRAAENHGDWWK